MTNDAPTAPSLNGTAPPGTPPPVQLLITFDPASGGLTVEGPTQLTLMCYGLLEAAKDFVRGRAMAAQAQMQQRIVPAGNAALSALEARLKK